MKMWIRQSVPEYLTNKKNTFLQIAFVALFAFVFINIYRPFGYDTWYFDVPKWKLLLASLVVVLTGMIVIVVSRLLLLHAKKSQEITFAVYIWFIIAEIISMGLFFTAFEIFILNDQRSPVALFYNAVQNTSLILLIPYTLSILFFAWHDIKKRFENTVNQFRYPSEVFIPFTDSKGQLKISIKSSDLLYLEANDNYVNIHYIDNQKHKKFVIRNTLKKFEKELRDYPVYRVHRKYSVNIKNVKILRHESSSYYLIMSDIYSDKIPLSKMYQSRIMKLINS